MVRFMYAAGIFFLAAQAVAQEEPSAFVDPFKPSPKGTSTAASEPKKSFLPKIPFPSLPAPGFSLPKLPKPKMPKMPSLPNLNPFANGKSPEKRVQQPQPNLFQQIGSGTRNFFNRTTHTLMPWTQPKPKIVKGAIVPAFMQSAKKQDEKKGSGIQLMNFFAPAQEKKKINTPGDFFRQERPAFRK